MNDIRRAGESKLKRIVEHESRMLAAASARGDLKASMHARRRMNQAQAELNRRSALLGRQVPATSPANTGVAQVDASQVQHEHHQGDAADNQQDPREGRRNIRPDQIHRHADHAQNQEQAEQSHGETSR